MALDGPPARRPWADRRGCGRPRRLVHRPPRPPVPAREATLEPARLEEGQAGTENRASGDKGRACPPLTTRCSRSCAPGAWNWPGRNRSRPMSSFTTERLRTWPRAVRGPSPSSPPSLASAKPSSRATGRRSWRSSTRTTTRLEKDSGRPLPVSPSEHLRSDDVLRPRSEQRRAHGFRRLEPGVVPGLAA